MKCQSMWCNEEATNEIYDMHHGFAITVHCKKHADVLYNLLQRHNRCTLIKEIPTAN